MHPIAIMKTSHPNVHMLSVLKNRALRQGSSNSRGSLVGYETHKITATTMSTTVAELHALMRCYGITGEIADVHIRTDANNLVTTASTTHQPEQKETMHNPNVAKGEQ